MNYWYLTRAPLNSRPLDYSRKTPVARDEAKFDEGLAFYDSYPHGADPDTSVPYVMWAGTPYQHLMAPVK